jgi:hypothetical protein
LKELEKLDTFTDGDSLLLINAARKAQQGKGAHDLESLLKARRK